MKKEIRLTTNDGMVISIMEERGRIMITVNPDEDNCTIFLEKGEIDTFMEIIQEIYDEMITI